jgi:hypothetical protein
VADLKEAMGMREKSREGAIRISGRIIDEKGRPLTGIYATARINKEHSGMPDFLSAWADEQGRYTLYVPKGKYYLGSALAFSPDESYVESGEITVEADRDGVDVVRKSNKAGQQQQNE